MATIKKRPEGLGQSGGFTPDGNLTTLRFTMETNSTGAIIGSDSTSAPTLGDLVVLGTLPEGMVLEDATVIVSKALTENMIGSLGFLYADGVDSDVTPQDEVYFGSGIRLDYDAARIPCITANYPVKLDKDAWLVMRIAGAANAKAGRVDVIVHGERMGPK